MTRHLINVGLQRNTGGTISAANVRKAIARHARIVESTVRQSDTEQTLVVEIEASKAIAPLLNSLCKSFAQDCIANYDLANRVGTLVGPQATKWGQFDPQFFLTLDGSRLG